ncbi:STAS domain-containing protein [Micromonospora sp. HK10]|uniref:STAS domain-containing protein n=1 Tax=Micromonospora sp. HK10 TaxID=1538294 RepID=UPI0006272B81|nr:STAS domain-containing protein [Micromonospora sp. HK10]KKK04606.1 anti-sigma-factor antagonist [Micromonospora sp. HK10]
MDQEAAPPVFSATAELDGDRLRVVVVGEVDMASADTMLRTVLGEPATHVTLDLHGVTFFDSAAIHAVVRLAQRLPGTLTVLPSRQVRRVLDVAGLGEQDWLADD